MLKSLGNWITTRRLWISPLFDLFVIAIVSIALFYLSFPIDRNNNSSFWPLLPNMFTLMLCIELFQIIFHTHRSLWRYAESRDYLMLIVAFGCGFVLYFPLGLLLFSQRMSYLYAAAVVSSSLLIMLTLRFTFRLYTQKMTSAAADANRRNGCHELLIIGAGGAGVAVQEEINRNPSSVYRVWSFLDDDPAKIGHRIRGVEVKGPISALPSIIKNSPVYEIVLAIPSLPLERRQEIVQLCRGLQCKLRILPDTLMVMQQNNMAYSAVLREVRIEDLLSRTSVDFDRSGLEAFLRNRTVLVTGAGGSIGTELCRQIAAYQPKTLILLDAYENSVYNLREELKRIFPAAKDIFIEIASVRDKQRLEFIFAKYRPELIFHAAAHKHVPLMESAPEEAVKNNIFGTYNLMTLAVQYQCAKFVQISTDKAVNPTNVMGATKRFCEMMVQAMADQHSGTDFVAVRFGNVLGSNGSVIPLFQAQIANGGPITITDRRITRYFMTIPEAASLVLQAGKMAEHSEIFVLDMGQAVRIFDLAEKMIALAGYTPGRDIEIKEIGLRPGEKLYEEPLITQERHTATSNSKIFIEKQEQRPTLDEINRYLRRLHAVVDEGDQQAIVRLLKQIIPTFRSPEEINAAQEKQDEQRQAQLIRQRSVDRQSAG